MDTELTVTPERETIDLWPNLVLVRTAGGSEYEASFDGVPIPHLTVVQTPDGWSVTLDRRFGFTISADGDNLQQVLLLTANAMAIAAGFSCFGEGSVVMNPYRRQQGPGAS